MGKLKVTLARKTSQLTKLKSTVYSIIFGKNLKKIDKKNLSYKEVKNKS